MWPTTGAGFPRTALGPPGTNATGRDLGLVPVIVNVVPQDGQQTVQPGASFRYPITGKFRVYTVSLSINVGVDFDLVVNGATVVTKRDGSGLVGDLQLGDIAANVYLDVTSCVISGVNNNNVPIDVLCYLLGVN